MSETLSRRDALTAVGAGALALGWGGRAVAAGLETLGYLPTEGYTLPPLPYAYNALEPHLDEATLRLHHDKHHASYVAGLNKAVETLAAARKSGDYAAVKAVSRDLAFNGSGHLLHCIFWTNLQAAAGQQPSGALSQVLSRSFGSVDAFKAHFAAAAKAVEGSGWAICAHEPLSGNLLVLQAEKHQNLTAWGVTPLLVLDVWEHAYYLKYQNNRGAYVDAFWNVVNWANVEARCQAAMGA